MSDSAPAPYSFRARLGDLALALIVLSLTFGAGAKFGSDQTMAAVQAKLAQMMSAKKAPAPAAPGVRQPFYDPSAPEPPKPAPDPSKPRIETDFKGGKPVARRAIDPVTGTATALPLDGGPG